MKLSKLFAGAALCASLVSGAAQASVVLSEDFNAAGQTLNWGGNGNFSVTGGSVDLIGTGFFDLYPGNGNYVDLDGSTGGGNSPAGQLTSLASFGAGSFVLDFYLGGNARGAAAKTTVITLGSWSTTITLNSADPLTLYSFAFSTTGGNLVFTENGPSDQQGNILDNITLSAVPEPATWALMITGFGLVGSTLRRRRAVAA